MVGPFSLTGESIHSEVSKSPGAYIILDSENDGVYVGRSDQNLQEKLKQHPPDTTLKFFFEHTPTAKAAFDLECLWFHEYTPRQNSTHPEKSDPGWTCMACGN